MPDGISTGYRRHHPGLLGLDVLGHLRNEHTRKSKILTEWTLGQAAYPVGFGNVRRENRLSNRFHNEAPSSYRRQIQSHIRDWAQGQPAL